MNVFLSYSPADAEFASKLKQELEAQGVGVTLDIESASIGDDLHAFLERAVRESAATLAVISRDSLHSERVIAAGLSAGLSQPCPVRWLRKSLWRGRIGFNWLRRIIHALSETG